MLVVAGPPVVRTAAIVVAGNVNRRVSKGLVTIKATLGAPRCLVIIPAPTVNK